MISIRSLYAEGDVDFTDGTEGTVSISIRSLCAEGDGL